MASARASAALLGAVVADAAAVSCHWQYDSSAIAAAVGSGDPAFHTPSICPFYTVAPGANSGYGDLILAGLKAASGDGHFSVDTYAAELERVFGPGSEYATAFAARPPGRPTGPVPGPWLFGSIKGSLTNLAAKKAEGTAPSAFGDSGTDDTDGLQVALATVAVQAAKGITSDADVEAAIHAAVTKPSTVGFARAGANILRAVISGSSIKEAVAQELARAGGEEDAAAHTALVAVLASVDAGTSYAAAAPVYGIGCPNPSSFSCALHAALTSSTYAEAVRSIILGGGDNCSRGIFAGALLAAAGGPDSIPAEWTAKTTNASTASAGIAALLA